MKRVGSIDLNNQVKKIVIFSAVFPPEPIVSAKISFDLAQELSKKDLVTVVCPTPTRPMGFKFAQKIEKFRFNVKVLDSYTCPESKLLGRIRENISFGQKCKAFIENNYKEIDVIYMNVWPLFSQFYIIHTAKRFHLRVVAHIQDIYPESHTNKLPAPVKQFFQWLLLPIDKYILRNSGHIVAISGKMKEYLVKTRFLNPGKISVVTNWQDENEFINYRLEGKMNAKNEILTFMYLGNIGPVAGVEFLIESFAAANLPGARLVVAGSGSMKEFCQNLCLKFADLNTAFVDVPNGKVPEIQDYADVMLLPVRKGAALSSIPSKLPAYMFSKKPIVGCVDRDSDTADSILKADCGWVIEPGNKEQLIDIYKLIGKQSRELLTKKGENGFRFAMERFSQKTNLKKMVLLFESQD